jgi:hypothetical protein
MWFDCGMQKKKKEAEEEEVVHVSNPGQWWNMLKRFSGIITHYINNSV